MNNRWIRSFFQKKIEMQIGAKSIEGHTEPKIVSELSQFAFKLIFIVRIIVLFSIQRRMHIKLTTWFVHALRSFFFLRFWCSLHLMRVV